MVERRPEEPRVGGSNPPRSAKTVISVDFLPSFYYLYINNRDMAAYYKLKTVDELKKIVEESETLSEVMKKLGYSGNRGNSIKGLKEYLDKVGIDYSKFSVKRLSMFSHPKVDLENILVEDCKYTNMYRLKERLLRTGLLGNECSICGLKEWMGKEIVLQLDHINGNNRDNRIENLRLLCPNCHSQTETFCGKKKKNNGHVA